MMAAVASTEAASSFLRRIFSIANFLKKDGRERCVDKRPKQQEKVAVQEEQDEPEEEEEGVAVGNTGLRRSARLWAV